MFNKIQEHHPDGVDVMMSLLGHTDSDIHMSDVSHSLGDTVSSPAGQLTGSREVGCVNVGLPASNSNLEKDGLKCHKLLHFL